MDPLDNLLTTFGFLLRFLGFLIVGFGIGHFFMDNYKVSEWQVRAALILGFFGLLVGLTAYASPGSSGAFAIGSGVALVYTLIPRKAASEEEENQIVG